MFIVLIGIKQKHIFKTFLIFWMYCEFRWQGNNCFISLALSELFLLCVAILFVLIKLNKGEVMFLTDSHVPALQNKTKISISSV